MFPKMSAVAVPAGVLAPLLLRRRISYARTTRHAVAPEADDVRFNDKVRELDWIHERRVSDLRSASVTPRRRCMRLTQRRAVSVNDLWNEFGQGFHWTNGLGSRSLEA